MLTFNDQVLIENDHFVSVMSAHRIEQRPPPKEQMIQKGSQ